MHAQTLLLLAAAAFTATAAPAPQLAGAAPCTPSSFEKLNLQHHHDINTGKIIIGSRLVSSSVAVGGRGCSPLWAGGSYDDRALFPNGQYPAWLVQQVPALQTAGGAATVAPAAPMGGMSGMEGMDMGAGGAATAAPAAPAAPMDGMTGMMDMGAGASAGHSHDIFSKPEMGNGVEVVSMALT
ncbi:hypothetical protein K402DRAFT_401459 [Aulographum hederae CBS 113979]|uniref:Uncharacterized protein n=1 Tax=Aulographum hederae CBS 113979 TaxID=1176131 RepID=A0A6G1HA74_9PEZI|nr:hypothetical protein K402DRAFT_401459 [Aulographum hederae CBS 113979]